MPAHLPKNSLISGGGGGRRSQAAVTPSSLIINIFVKSKQATLLSSLLLSMYAERYLSL